MIILLYVTWLTMAIPQGIDEDVRVGDGQRQRPLNVLTEASSSSPASSRRVPRVAFACSA
jgi:hypothetical protein